MAALAKDRNTSRHESDYISVPVKAAAKIYAGSLVVADGGYAKPAAKAASLIALGRAEEFVDNSSGANGDLKIKIRRGVFKWATTAAAAGKVTVTEIGKDVYIADDQTVDKRDAATSKAGKCLEIAADGEVWVETR